MTRTVKILRERLRYDPDTGEFFHRANINSKLIMTKPLALAFLCKDRLELSKQSIEPLVHENIDLWIIDGSQTEDAQAWLLDGPGFPSHILTNVTGGADAAIVYALTTLLNETESPYVGITENDVLLHPDWLGPTLSLFERGAADGLSVGAVSARAYDDRILVQRDGFALMHNLGSGHIILTRQAARLVLDHYRSPWSMENRRTFCQLSGLDVAKWWAFGGSQQFLTVDWGFDAVLARHGLASLALSPALCEMIGQDPPLEQQGLRLADKPVELLRNDKAFEVFVERSRQIRDGVLNLGDQRLVYVGDSWIIFAHQIGLLGGQWYGLGEWRTVWSQGFGPFCYEAHPATEYSCYIDVPVSGPCSFIVSGGKTGGRVELTDTHSNYQVAPELPPEGPDRQTVQLAVPGVVTHRTIRLRMLSPGTRFYGIRVQEPQPYDPTWVFDHSVLPRP